MDDVFSVVAIALSLVSLAINAYILNQMRGNNAEIVKAFNHVFEKIKSPHKME